MSDNTNTHYMKLVEDSEIVNVPREFHAFLTKSERSIDEYATWSYYARGYERAFEHLADVLANRLGREHYLFVPFFFICRHSMELLIKSAINECNRYAVSPAKLTGHGLRKLWRTLLVQVSTAGFPIDDEWTKYCEQLVSHVDLFDPKGESFRYPTDVDGNPFAQIETELNNLCVAHWHVAIYCGSIESMVNER